MAITFVGATDVSGTSTHTGAATPVACPAPSHLSGDVLLIQVQDSGTGATITVPSGWTAVEVDNTSSTHRSWLFGRIADGTTTDDFSATITGPAQWLADMVAYRGVDVSGALLVTAVVAHAQNNSAAVTETSHTSPSVTTTIDACALVGFFTEDSVGTAHTWSPTSTSPSIGTPTERFDVDEQTQKQEMCGDDAFGAAAATSYTMTVALASAEVINSFLVALAPSVSTIAPRGPVSGAQRIFGT